MFMKIRPMESNLLNSASDFHYDTRFYFEILSLAAKISARWLHCKCYSIVSCSPLILIGTHFLSLEINQLHDLSLFKNMMKKRPCSEINAFKNSDAVWRVMPKLVLLKAQHCSERIPSPTLNCCTLFCFDVFRFFLSSKLLRDNIKKEFNQNRNLREQTEV